MQEERTEKRGKKKQTQQAYLATAAASEAAARQSEATAKTKVAAAAAAQSTTTTKFARAPSTCMKIYARGGNDSLVYEKKNKTTTSISCNEPHEPHEIAKPGFDTH